MQQSPTTSCEANVLINSLHFKAPRLLTNNPIVFQGYLSFWNDNISYTLRGCIIMELALRHRIAMVRDPNRRRFPLADRLVCSFTATQMTELISSSLGRRYIEVIDDKLTGEVLLDEALKMMKVSERMSVGTWIDLMSGEEAFIRHIIVAELGLIPVPSSIIPCAQAKHGT